MTDRNVDVVAAAATSKATLDSDGCGEDEVAAGGDVANCVGGGTYGIGTTSSCLMVVDGRGVVRATGDVGVALPFPFMTAPPRLLGDVVEGLEVETDAPVDAEFMVKTPARRTGTVVDV